MLIMSCKSSTGVVQELIREWDAFRNISDMCDSVGLQSNYLMCVLCVHISHTEHIHQPGVRLPITRRQIFDSSKLKEFADDNFKFDENGKKLSKWVGNTVGNGEIARYEQFLLFPQCFQKVCFPGESKGVIVWEWVNW